MIKAEHECELMVRLKDGEELISSFKELSLDSGVLLNGVGMLRDLELGYWNGSSYEVKKDHRAGGALIFTRKLRTQG